MPGMRLVSICLPEAWLDRIEDLIRAGTFPNRSAFVRYAVWRLLLEMKAIVPPPETVYCPYCSTQMQLVTNNSEPRYKCPDCGALFRLKEVRR